MTAPLRFPFGLMGLPFYNKEKPDSNVDFVDTNQIEEMAEDDGKARVVSRTHFVLVPLMSAEPIPLELSHCTQFIQVDRYLGEFNLLDDAGRVLGTSKQGRLSLLKKDLTTEVAKVWYDAIARTSQEHKRLVEQYHVEDPGLDLEGLHPLRLQFLNISQEQAKIVHVPLYCRITCVWDPRTFAFVSM